MKVSILQENLQAGLKHVRRVVPNKPQLPILSSLLFSAEAGTGITLAATDLYTGIQTTIPGSVDAGGAVAIPASIFVETVATLSPGPITLEEEDGKLTISSSNTTATIQCFPADDYPPFPDKEGSSVTISTDQLAEIITLVTVAVASDETRPVLTSVLFRFSTDSTLVVATDGFRLAVMNLEGVETSDSEMTELLIPAAALREAQRLSATVKSKQVTFRVSQKLKQVFCSFDTTDMVIRLMEGDFPPFEKVLPQQFVTEAVVDGPTFQQHLKGAQVFAKESSNVVTLSFAENELKLSATSPSAGEHISTMPAQISGNAPLTIAFNAQYIQDFLRSASPESLAICMNEPLQPAVFRPENLSSYSYVVMPFRQNT